MRKAFYLICFILTVALFHACAGSSQYKKTKTPDNQMQHFLADKPAELHSTYRQLLDEGKRNEVLNLMRLGLDTMQLGYLSHAEWAFDRALTGIEIVYANNKQATKARSMWFEEGSKNFKGEAYERVMAYYYRGLLYIIDGDYQNARASFKGGMLQDAFAEEEQHRCDFASLLYISGWCSQRIPGDTLSQPTFEELQKLRPDITLPGQEDNVLLVIETGKSPRKLSDGVGHYQLKFRRGRKFSDKKVRFKIEGGPEGTAYPVEDIFWQATTRGGRQFDHILKGTAVFKKKAYAAGSALSDVAANTIIASTIFENSASELQGIGAGIGLISVISQVASVKARAEADTRYWDNLPDAVHVATCKLAPGNYNIEVIFLDGRDNVLVDLTKVVNLEVPEIGSKLFWLRSRNQIYSK